MSGKSIKEFCEEQNLSTRRYFYWQRKLRAEQPEWFAALEAEYYRSRPNDAPLEIFLPVEIQSPAAVTIKNDQLTVELKSGHRILIVNGDEKAQKWNVSKTFGQYSKKFCVGFLVEIGEIE